jgi:hypothetical protein
MSGLGVLQSLLDQGCSWRMLSECTGIAEPVLRTMARAGTNNPLATAKLAALTSSLYLLRRQHGVDDPVAWLESPIQPDAPITRMTVLAAEQFDLLFGLATGAIHPEKALDRFEPGWRDRYFSVFKTVPDSDGHLSIVSKTRQELGL